MTQAPPARRFFLAALALAACGLLLFFLFGRSRAKTPSEEQLLETSKSRPSKVAPDQADSSIAPPGSAGPTQVFDGSRALAKKRLERARQTLEGYLLATRYPPGSRPISEKPDLVEPHSVAKVTLPLVRKDQKETDARVILEQDRLYVVGDEAARLTISCVTSEGPAPCEVLTTKSFVPESMTNAPVIEPSPVPFSGDAVKSALFAPANHGFGGYHGPITIELQLRVDGEEGGARFEVIYTPASPARFTGNVREVLENGTLCLHVQLQVDKPGRYIIVGRVDDADGDRFGYLDFNDPLQVGLQEAPLCIFGKLVHDEQAKAPFVLRDVEGFLLKESFPDRETIAGRDGPFYTTKPYETNQFSDAEWQSEEKKRHVDEFTKDVKEAEAVLNGDKPAPTPQP